jgi:hypothetical protein
VVSLSTHFTLRLTDEEMKLLDAGCKSVGVNRSSFIRLALRQAAGSSDVGQRLARIEADIAEIKTLLRQGGVSVSPSAPTETDEDSSMREELAQSLRGILDDGV